MLLRALADRIAEVSFEALPGEAVATAKHGILDTVGVTLAGARDDTLGADPELSGGLA